MLKVILIIILFLGLLFWAKRKEERLILAIIFGFMCLVGIIQSCNNE